MFIRKYKPVLKSVFWINFYQNKDIPFSQMLCNNLFLIDISFFQVEIEYISPQNKDMLMTIELKSPECNITKKIYVNRDWRDRSAFGETVLKIKNYIPI